MLINPHTNLNKSNKNPQNEPNQSKPKHFNINTCLSKSHKNLTKIPPKSQKWANPQTDPNKTSATPNKPQQKTTQTLKKHVRVWLWTKPAGNVHLPAIPLFLRVGMLPWIQHVFLNRKSVAGTHWFIYPKNQHLQQKSIKIPSSTHKCVSRDVSGFLDGFSTGLSRRFQLSKAQRQDSPFFTTLRSLIQLVDRFHNPMVYNNPQNSLALLSGKLT